MGSEKQFRQVVIPIEQLPQHNTEKPTRNARIIQWLRDRIVAILVSFIIALIFAFLIIS